MARFSFQYSALGRGESSDDFRGISGVGFGRGAAKNAPRYRVTRALSHLER